MVENLDVDILAGTPFMSTNDVAVRSAKRKVILRYGITFTYGYVGRLQTDNAVRRAIVSHAPSTQTTVWPGDFLEINLLRSN